LVWPLFVADSTQAERVVDQIDVPASGGPWNHRERHRDTTTSALTLRSERFARAIAADARAMLVEQAATGREAIARLI
jgi:hypothetical protein